MSTENFDDAIKRKLESIEPLINNKDIDRVHQYVTMHRSSFPFLRSPRFFWGMMGTAMLATCLVTWKLTTVLDHSAARQPVAAIAQKAAETAAAPVATKSANTTAAQSNNNTIASAVNNNAGLTSAAGDIQNHAARAGIRAYASKDTYGHSLSKRLKGGTDHSITSMAVSAGNASEKPASGMPADISGNNASFAANQSVNGTQNNGNSAIASEAKNNTGEAATASQTINTATAGNGQDAKAANDNAGEKMVNPNISLAKLMDSAKVAEKKKDTTALASKKAPGHDYADAHKKAPKNNAAFHLNYMAGAGYEYDKSQNGWGVFGKVLVNNRFGLNVGFKMMNINNQTYTNDTGYDNTHSGSFRSKFAPGLSNDFGIYNIGLKYSLMQIPVSVEYNLPVTNTISFSLALGTDIDINCTEAIGFDEINYQFRGSPPILNVNIYHQDVSKTYAPAILNNLVISPGFTWQFYRHLALQASGFVSPQLRDVYYKGTDNYFWGGNLKVYYVF